MDGSLCIPGGHVEDNETPRQAAIRELKEELGVSISVDDLEFLCVAARDKDPDAYVAYEFILKDKDLDYLNCEPDKCAELVWIDIDNLPGDVIPAFADIINNAIVDDKKYLELKY